jgi:uncharacterized protein YndB with AHSA1/START domain
MMLAIATVLAGATLAAPAAERALDKEVLVKAGVDPVWETWTTKAGIISFMAPAAEIDARVGGAFHVYFDPLAEPGARGADDMRYMALQPKRLISFDWNAPPSLPEVRGQRTFVAVRLSPVDQGTTRVTMHHTGWGDGGEWDKAYAYFDRAWGTVLGNLKKRFESGPIDWTDWMRRLEAMHKEEAGKSARE